MHYKHLLTVSSTLECAQEDFDCGNNKCVSQSVLCDGIDHCGNMRDEVDRCGEIDLLTS